MTILRVMSFNVFSPGEPEDRWAERADLNLRTIGRYRPDLVGLQEVNEEKHDAYRRRLEGYAFVEYGSETDSRVVGQQRSNAICWKRERFDLLDHGVIWLSRTPDEPSTDWGIPYSLGVSWARLRDREGSGDLLHLNTQFEDGPWGEESRVGSSNVIAQRAVAMQEALDGPAVLLTGDFNYNPSYEAYRILAAAGFVDTYRAAGHGDSAASSTFHGLCGEGYFALEWGNEVFWRVDWVLAREGARRLQTTSCTIARDAEPPLYPSDHYPVVADVRIGERRTG